MKSLITFFSDYWTAFFILAVILLVVPDIIAVIIGHRDGLGDKLTATHWLVTKVGLSIIGAFVGYLVAHFLIVHKNG